VTKGSRASRWAGNASPRIIETPAGMMNAVGLQNIGVQAFLAEKLPKLRQMAGAVVIANVFGFEIEDYVRGDPTLNDAEGVACTN